nr:adenylate/guanylate cyclase domain-containing protein [Desulfobacterales bacterium]
PQGITQKIISQHEKLEGERRQVTVLFCDMKGFTPLVDGLDSESAYQIMDKVYEILIHSVHEFEGTVNEMTGDGIMALFGAPVAQEDAPQRAVRAAISIHRDIARFNHQDLSIAPLKMRIGIHTGPVIVGTLGNEQRVQFKAVGDTVNLASRLEQMAEPGTTLVTEETFKQTRHIFRFKAIGKKAIKGKKDPVLVYNVLSAKKDIFHSRMGAERLIYSKMVGRHQQLDHLELQLMKVVKGQGSIISIIGEAGIGKSRLAAEMKESAVIKRIFWLEGRAVSIGRHLSFHPIIDLLKQWAQINHDDSDAVAYGKLKIALKRIFPDEFSKRLPFVAALMGIKLYDDEADTVKDIEGEALEKLIIENVRELLIRTSELTPLVVLIEDLHWFDTSSIELLESLFDLAQRHRILFLNIFRPGYMETGERIVASIKAKSSAYYVEIHLERLDERHSNTLIKNMLSHSVLEHNVMQQIITAAGGNPYFIEEIVRSLIDKGALVPTDGKFQVTSKIATTTIPSTIYDVLMSRIDQIDEATRDLVRVAAIVGRTFLLRIIEEVAVGIEDIDTRLSYLKDLQLIIEHQRTGELEYGFKHGLAQETVYLSMLPQKRKHLHLQVAYAIEKIFSNKLHEFYGILSYHFNQGADLDKAEEYMLKAGDEAMKISASNEALEYYKTAIELYIRRGGDVVDINKIARLEENIAIAFFNKGNFVEAVSYFERSLKNSGVKIRTNTVLLTLELVFNLATIVKSLYLPSVLKKKTPSERDNRIMKVKFKMAHALAYVDINRVFLDNVRLVPQAFKFDIHKAPAYLDVLVGGSALFAITGLSFRLSKKILKYVEDLLSQRHDNVTLPATFFRFIENMVNCLTGQWHHQVNDEIVENALRVGDVVNASGYLIWLGYSKLERGDLDELQKIIGLLKDIGNRYNFEYATIDHYYLSSKLALIDNELDHAMRIIDDGIVLLDKFGLNLHKVGFLGVKVKILALQNDFQSAQKVLKEAEDLVIKVGKKAILPNYYGDYLIGRFCYFTGKLQDCLARDRPIEFKKYYKEALKTTNQGIKHFRKRTPIGRTEAYKLIGRYFWLVKDQRKAEKWWNKSILEGHRLHAKVALSNTISEVERTVSQLEGP